MHSNAKHGMKHSEKKGSAGSGAFQTVDNGTDGNTMSEYGLSSGSTGAPKSVKQGPSGSHLAEHKLQHADYGEITGGESTEL